MKIFKIKNKALCQNWPLRKYIQREELEVKQVSPINVYFNDKDNDYILMATNKQAVINIRQDKNEREDMAKLGKNA